MSPVKKLPDRYNPDSADFKKEEFPFYWLAMVYGRYSMAMEKTLKKIDMDIPRRRVLFILKDNGESSMSDISMHAIAKLSTITKIVYRMKEDGLVETRPSPEDGRVTLVSITDAGLATLSQIHQVTSGILAKGFRGLSDAQIAKLNDTLEKMFRNLPED